MEDIMTDKQFDKILKMVSMILDGCNDLDEAKEKVSQLIETEKKEKSAEWYAPQKLDTFGGAYFYGKERAKI